MAHARRNFAQPSRRALAGLIVGTLFASPLATVTLSSTLSARVQVAALWGAAGVAVALFALVGRVPVSPRLALPGLLWVLATLLTVATAASRVSSAFAAANLLPAIVLAVAIAVCARKAGVRRRMLAAWVGSAAVASVCVIAQRYGGALGWTHSVPAQPARMAGAPGYLGAFLALSLPFAIAMFRFRRRPRWLGAAVATIVFALVVSCTRAAWAAAAVGVAVTMYAAGRSEARSVKGPLATIVLLAAMATPVLWMASPAAGAVATICVAAGLAWWLGSIPGFAGGRRALVLGLAASAAAVFAGTYETDHAEWMRSVRAIGQGPESASAREHIWNTANNLVGKRPLLGWGPDGFRVAAPGVAKDAVSIPDPLLFPHQSARSEWYTAAVEGGAVGLIAWACVLLALASLSSDRARAEQNRLRDRDGSAPPEAPCRTAHRRADIAAANFGAIAAFAVQGSFTPRGPATTLALTLCWGLAAALEPSVRGRIRVNQAVARTAGYAWAAFALTASAAILAAAALGDRGAALRAAGRPDAALPLFRLAARCDPSEPGYRFALAQTSLQLAAGREGLPAVQLAEDAAEACRQNLGAEPANGIWRAGLTSALCHINPEQAVVQGRRAVREAPLSGMAWMALSRAYRAAGNELGEKFALRAAIESEPLDSEPYRRLAEIFRNEKRPDLSDRLLGWAADLYPDAGDLAPWRAGAKPSQWMRLGPSPHPNSY